MFDDLDEICDKIDVLEGKTPLKSEGCSKAAASSSAPGPAPPRDDEQQLAPSVPLLPKPTRERVEEQQLEVEQAPLGHEPEAFGRRRPTTLEHFLALQGELHERFASADFQRRLKQLEEVYGKGYEGYGGEQERAALFLTVHSEVLPRYGFEGTQAGVLEMLQVASAHNGNAEFRANRDALNQLLGLAPTPEDLAMGRGAKGKGKGKLKGKGKGKASLQVSVGEVLSLLMRDSPWAARRSEDTSTTAGTEPISEDPEGM
eukprot:CAMPEP_0179142934 /NCGR_PEP_ID=MMETSP0796-20121207/68694_1 /TAXON_ID=73915 /ORGANISM="Pyrodinium bahamense, Strain pbaha01" /LENGTH=258 /DNA_ID=CAMNT_0020842877 /DNA_START=23 /DNA_END=799 /DNA_ORIENTATION=-